MVPSPDDFHGIVALYVTNIKTWIIGKERPCPDQNGIAHGSEFVIPAVGSVTCDFQGSVRTICTNHSHKAILAYCAFNFYKRTFIAYKIVIRFKEPLNIIENIAARGFAFGLPLDIGRHIAQKSGITPKDAASGHGAISVQFRKRIVHLGSDTRLDTFIDFYAGFFQNTPGISADNGIRVRMGEIDLFDSRVDDCLCARGRAAIMATRFKSHEYGRAAGEFARVTQRHDFGVGTPGALRSPLPHYKTILHDNRAHRRIRATFPNGRKCLGQC